MATVEAPRTEVRAEARYVRTAPRKAQLVTEQIRGRSVLEARAMLAFMTRDAARDVEKVLESAVANALANHGIDAEDLYVSSAYAGAGPTLKRWRARARGRVARIKKRTCHITIRLAQPDGSALPEGRAPVAATVAPEAPPAEPARRRARKQPAEAETAEAAEETPEAPPKRASKPKAAEKDEAGDEKPKRPRAEPKADEAADRPKRAPRKKKSDEEGEGS